MVEYLIGIHDFKGRSPDELDISKGDYVEVIEDDAEFGDSWYIGRNLSTNKTGLLPKVFTTEVQPPDVPSNDFTATLSDIDQALYDIAAHSAPNPESVAYWTPYDVRTFFISRQFSEGVAERFVQHQITGSILLQLDANLLKELDIPSFGTRFEIAKEIEQLRAGVDLSMPPVQEIEGDEASLGASYGRSSIDEQSPATSTIPPQRQSVLHRQQSTASNTMNFQQTPLQTNGQSLGSPMPQLQSQQSHRRSISELNDTQPIATKSAPEAASDITSPPKASGHHRRQSSVSSILSGPTNTPMQGVSSPAANGRESGGTPRFQGLKNAKSQYLKPALVKQKTSAFLEGIRDTTAEESAKSADHSGWMQKRGGMGVGSWKGRFFTLHGTRLSYFTNFKDTKERGLIDITGHKALPFGPEDKLIALHAASFGAGKYGFKLLPPGPGFKKGVSFTAPRVHHFAVDSEKELHQWLQALMKATIERDNTVAPVSSCTTPVVSLPKAQEIIAERLAHYYDSDGEEGDINNLNGGESPQDTPISKSTH